MLHLRMYFIVMPGLVPGIHVFGCRIKTRKTWVAGARPAMTVN
jgi:hypothetical protein